MSHENEIPEYALQPARAPKITEAEAVYDTEKTVHPEKEMRVTYQFEEDILVPDVKADMREILLMYADCDITPSEKKIAPKTDDLLNITGTITLQTIYDAESEDSEPVAITSRIPYKYQWDLNPAEQAEGVFGCRVKNLEYMIINERKFRVKVMLEFTGQLFAAKTFAFFSGLKDEELEMQERPVAITCMGLVKKDELSIDETFKAKDSGMRPEFILKQDFAITENYRQVTTEKIVINGFLFCSILYSAISSEDGEGRTVLCQHNQRIEFTQFVSVEKEHRGKTWSAVKTFFNNKDLHVGIEHEEENPDEIHFRIKGDIRTRVELYETRQRNIIADAYHREKEFDCRFSTLKLSNASGNAMAETSIREIVSLPEGMKASEAVYCLGKIISCQCDSEKGRVVVTGTASCNAMWRDDEGRYHVEKIIPDFRGVVDLESARTGQQTGVTPMIKTAWVEMINEKQLEVNCTIQLCVDTFEESEIVFLENPCFVDKVKGKVYPMVIVSVQPGETLWTLAKRYRTTEEHIRIANQLEGEAEPGRRLLIVK